MFLKLSWSTFYHPGANGTNMNYYGNMVFGNYDIGNAIVRNENNKPLYRLAQTMAYLESFHCLALPGNNGH